MHKKAVIKSIKEDSSDFKYWLSRPESERLAAIEMLRQQYIQFKFPNAQLRFQRVYKIVKQ
jgi:hypothetical protein